VAKLVGKTFLNPQLGMSLHEISMIMELRVVNFATSKNLIVESTMFPHCNIHKFTRTSPGGKTHNQIDHIWIDRRLHSSALDAQSFRRVDCINGHCLVMAKVRG
jgi:hypothetical protein